MECKSFNNLLKDTVHIEGIFCIFFILLEFPSHFPIHCKLMAFEFANSSWSDDEFTVIEFMKTKRRRPMREWTAVEYFCSNDEAKAVGLINAETPNSALDGSKSTV